ncbi:UDP-N-acetylglucosamine 2-epimerase (non-hydrolyzing) [candidate division KSB1 bacterium]|nr:UDP-N-acetylglucosamine 2-epimerase (non-hydrolyzing) [candidate division KSB1 bacterium]RQW02454.1 MAG: UDP-N-acetylglucosamine 2-epimerase (non-hydrolyzing) [candidate division KSB1 bacterium]
MKILSLVGARPQFIKLAPLSCQIRQHHHEVILHTGQHFDGNMSDAFFTDLDIASPDYNLNINQGHHGEQTGRMLIEIERVLLAETPDMVIVFGDTNSTLAGALAGAKLHIPVIHVEAGLRSFNRQMPEELNRIVVDHVSDCLFAPTITAMNHLKTENLADNSFLTGDIMVDSLAEALARMRDSVLDSHGLEADSYYVLTLHRPYTVDHADKLMALLSRLADAPLPVLFPVHPRTRAVLEKYNLRLPRTIALIKPMGYLDFVHLMANATKILTDSGGIQKEAYILRKPCITLRTETEWVETVSSGWNLLLPPDEENLIERIESFRPPTHYTALFGENVAAKMVDIIDRLSDGNVKTTSGPADCRR